MLSYCNRPKPAHESWLGIHNLGWSTIIEYFRILFSNPELRIQFYFRIYITLLNTCAKLKMFRVKRCKLSKLVNEDSKKYSVFLVSSIEHIKRFISNLSSICPVVYRRLSNNTSGDHNEIQYLAWSATLQPVSLDEIVQELGLKLQYRRSWVNIAKFAWWYWEQE